MFIDATIIVQAIHFFIAYVILRTLFFRPALQELEMQKAEKQGLEDRIQYTKMVLEKKQHIRDEQWHETREFFDQNKPQVEEIDLFFFRDITPELKAPHISESESDILVNQASNAITETIKKIYHV